MDVPRFLSLVGWIKRLANDVFYRFLFLRFFNIFSMIFGPLQQGTAVSIFGRCPEGLLPLLEVLAPMLNEEFPSANASKLTRT